MISLLSTGACSSVDHFAVSRRLYCQVQDVRIADSGDNLSNHCPLILEICVSLLSHPVSLRSTQSNSYQLSVITKGQVCIKQP